MVTDRDEQREEKQGAGQDSECELQILLEIVHERQHRKHLLGQCVHPASGSRARALRVVLPNLHFLLQRVDLLRHSVHQRNPAEGGVEQDLPGQLSRHSQVIHVIAHPSHSA